MEPRDTIVASSSSSPLSSPEISNSKASSPIGRFCKKYLSPRRSTELIKPSSLPILDIGQKSNDLERVFNYFDEDGDGKISPAELQKGVRTVGGELSDEDAEMVVRTSDADGDGLLGLEDFTLLMEAGGEGEKRDELKEAFDMYAVEGTNRITPKSLKKMFTRLGEKTSTENCKLMIRKYDLNGDGVLDFDEFSVMMR